MKLNKLINKDGCLLLNLQYICRHEESNDLDNSDSYGGVVSHPALYAAEIYRSDGSHEERAV